MGRCLGFDESVELPVLNTGIQEARAAAAAAAAGCIAEVDLGYPSELHDTRNDYPLAVTRRAPSATGGVPEAGAEADVRYLRSMRLDAGGEGGEQVPAGGGAYLVAVELRRGHVLLDRPLSAGLAVLDTPKRLVYVSRYGRFKPVYGQRAQLLLTDTDSLACVVTNSGPA